MGDPSCLGLSPLSASAKVRPKVPKVINVAGVAVTCAYDKFEACPHINTRWPELQNQFQLILYMCEESGYLKKGCVIKLWDDEGNRRTRRHDVNPRQQNVVEVRCGKRALKKGALTYFRGSIFYQRLPLENRDGLVGGASMVGGNYIAERVQPGNALIMIIKDPGLDNAMDASQKKTVPGAKCIAGLLILLID